MKSKKKERSKKHRSSTKKRKRHHEEEKSKDNHTADIQNANNDDGRNGDGRRIVISSESSSPSSSSSFGENVKREQQDQSKKEKKKAKKRKQRSVEGDVALQDDGDDEQKSNVDDDGNDTREKKKKKEKKSKRKKKEKKKEKRHADIDLDNDEDEADQQQEQQKSKKLKMTQTINKSDNVVDDDENGGKADTGNKKKDRTVASSAIEFYDNLPPPRGPPVVVDDSKTTTTNDSTEAAKNSITLLLFYQYIEPVWDESMYDYVLKTLQRFGNELKLTGRMRVAKEGLNCTLTGSHASITEYCHRLRTHPKFNNAFQDTEFKLTTDLPLAQKFTELKVFKVVELVHYGLEGSKAPPIAHYQGTHLEPKDYHKKIAENNTVIIDVRNHYEAAIGRFVPPQEEQPKKEKEQAKNNDESNGPAPKWLDPLMRKSTEFPVWLDKPETKEEMKGKQVLMYCTGGIRCERASALLKYKMETDPEIKALGIKGVYQLQGGIDKYFKEFPDGGYWKGKNYVFDKRFSHAPPKVDAVLHSGTGGSGSTSKQQKQDHEVKDEKMAAVLRSETKQSCNGETSGDVKQAEKKDGEVEKKIDIMGQCEACNKPWDMYRGKRRCPTCGVPSLICRDCFQQKKLLKNVRCDLCVAQGITSKKELRQRDVAEIKDYERRMSQRGLLRPEKIVVSAAPNPNGVTRLVLNNMCRKNMDEQALTGLIDGVTHIVWKIERKSGKFLGQAWVEMATPDDAARAVAKDGKLTPFGRPLYVSYQPPDGKDLWPPPNSAVGRY